MFAIAFDLTVSEIERLHPRSVPAGYTEIGRALARFGFEWKQGSVYIGKDEDLGNLYQAISALKDLPWFSASVRDIRAFRVEQWSDLTPIFKS
jgi:virulence-associated protein VapD